MSKDCDHEDVTVLLDGFNGVTVADCHGCGKRLIAGQPFDDDWDGINEEYKRLHGRYLFAPSDAEVDPRINI